MYNLRVLEKRGKELAELGVTDANIEHLMFGNEKEEENED